MLNTNNVIPAIPPFIDTSSNNEFSIHTDDSAIINAEEAIESEMHNKILGSGDMKAKLEIYKKIGTEEFDDTILFKHSVRKRQNCMTASTMSLSSTSSDEKDGKVVTPSIMNLSSVGLLPDLRSPDTILNDIKEKETKLADILNLENVKINMKDLQEKQDPKENVTNPVSKEEEFDTKYLVESTSKTLNVIQQGNTKNINGKAQTHADISSVTPKSKSSFSQELSNTPGK